MKFLRPVGSGDFPEVLAGFEVSDVVSVTSLPSAFSVIQSLIVAFVLNNSVV